MKYIAILPKGMNHWIWFKKSETRRDSIKFCGYNGWGRDGARTSVIDLYVNQIEGTIESDELQYRN